MPRPRCSIRRPHRLLVRGGTLAVAAAALASLANAQTRAEQTTEQRSVPSPVSDAPALVREALAVLSSKAMGAAAVRWQEMEQELLASVRAGDPPTAAYDAVIRAVRALDDKHARFEPSVPPSAPLTPPPAVAVDPASRIDRSPSPPTRTTAEMLPDGVAYVVVPGCFTGDASGLRSFARHTRDEIVRVAALRPTAWVIDLRLNGGGNVWPMILGMRPLLPEGGLMTMHDPAGAVSTFGVSGDSAWIDWGAGPEPQLQVASDDAPPEPGWFDGRLAVLLGPWTMSSGEALAICLRARHETRFFGEPTAGLTTVTNIFPLSDGSRLILSVAQMGDKSSHKVLGRIDPDEPVPFDNWPAPDDAVAKAARAWALAPR